MEGVETGGGDGSEMGSVMEGEGNKISDTLTPDFRVEGESNNNVHTF